MIYYSSNSGKKPFRIIRLSKIACIAILFGFSVGVKSQSSALNAQDKPNIILIYADDLDADEIEYTATDE